MGKQEHGSAASPVRPGVAFGKRRARGFPKGRQVEPAALKDITRLLGGRPPQRDRLIEYLHLIQDKYGSLSAARLAALAQVMKLAMAEVFEVATFYHHFDVVKENEAAPPEITIRVCNSLSCELAGAAALIEDLKRKAPGYVRVLVAPCMGRCDAAPAAAVGQNYGDRATAAGLLKLAKGRKIRPEKPKYQGFAAYAKAGGYRTLKALRSGAKTPEQVIEILARGGTARPRRSGISVGQEMAVRARRGGAALSLRQRR